MGCVVWCAGEPGVRLRDEAHSVHGPDHDERRRPEVSHLQHEAKTGQTQSVLLRRRGLLRSHSPPRKVNRLQVSDPSESLTCCSGSSFKCSFFILQGSETREHSPGWQRYAEQHFTLACFLGVGALGFKANLKAVGGRTWPAIFSSETSWSRAARRASVFRHQQRGSRRILMQFHRLGKQNASKKAGGGGCCPPCFCWSQITRNWSEECRIAAEAERESVWEAKRNLSLNLLPHLSFAPKDTSASLIWAWPWSYLREGWCGGRWAQWATWVSGRNRFQRPAQQQEPT